MNQKEIKRSIKNWNESEIKKNAEYGKTYKEIISKGSKDIQD
jgi:hypothetical protein